MASYDDPSLRVPASRESTEVRSLFDAPASGDGASGRVNPDPGKAFRAAFPPPIKAALVAAVQRAYQHAQETHVESFGSNAQTFGYNLYHFACHEIDRLCRDSSGGLERVEDVGALFRFQNGPYRLGVYKVGRSAAEDIWEALPTSDNGGVSGETARQLLLDGFDDLLITRVDQLRYAVVAHLGNAEHGLGAVYLCIPIETEHGKITRWGYTEPLFVAEHPAAHRVPTPAQPAALPQEEPEEEVIVRPKGVSAASGLHDRSR